MYDRQNRFQITGATLIIGSLCLCLILAVWMLMRGEAASAQEKATTKPDAAAVVTDLDDIGRLQVITPLKLQPDQLDKLAAALTTAQAEYTRKVTALGTQIFSPSVDEVREMRKKALNGEAIPKNFEDKIKKLQADFLKQRDDLNTENIQRVATACRAILTESQVSLATKLEREDWQKEHPDPKSATDNQLFNLYCVDVFISNPRIVPLLKEMRAASK